MFASGHTFDLDYIFCEGDSNYKQLNTLNLPAADQRPNVVQTADGRMFSVEYFSLGNGECSFTRVPIYQRHIKFL